METNQVGDFLVKLAPTIPMNPADHVSGGRYSLAAMTQIVKEDIISVFLITAADPSLSLWMTIAAPLIMTTSMPRHSERDKNAV
ncbi:hypothetical protein ACSZOP_07865 [Colibacter massiliensis]|uniref:hypothetical protein n=1 Tax=Colibacter massiliensis TaxID=1852379 RepID=UPI003F8DAEBC